MEDIVKKLRELNVSDEDYVTLNYTEGADVWHINESHVEETVSETNTASMLGNLLASGVTVSDIYSEGDILSEMRSNGLLEDYEREGDFEDYLTEQLVNTIYDGEYSIEYSTEQYDYKRGFCNISTEVRVRVADLYKLGPKADSILAGFDVSVSVNGGTLTLG